MDLFNIFIILEFLVLLSVTWVLFYAFVAFFWLVQTIMDPAHKIRVTISVKNALLGTVYMFVLHMLILFLGLNYIY